MSSFLPLINSSVTISGYKHINNHIMKYGQFFKFFICIVFINVLINVIHVMKYSIKVIESLQCFEYILLRLFINYRYFGSYGSLCINMFYQYLADGLSN